MKICSNCQEMYTDEYNFCKKCGSKLGDNTLECASCKAKVDAAAEFCPVCGKPLYDDGKCASCGHFLVEGALFCPGCGAKVESSGLPKRPAVQQTRPRPNRAQTAKKGRKIVKLIKVSVAALFFAICFGMSFTNVIQVENETPLGSKYIGVNIIDITEALATYKDRESVNSSLQEFIKESNITQNSTEAQMTRALEKYNILKIMINKETMDVAEFSILLQFIPTMIAGYTMMAAMLAFFIIMLVKTIILATALAQGRDEPFAINDRSGLFMGLTVLGSLLLAVFAAVTDLGPAITVPLSLAIGFIIDFYIVDRILDYVFEKKGLDKKQIKALVSSGVTYIFAFVFIFCLPYGIVVSKEIGGASTSLSAPDMSSIMSLIISKTADGFNNTSLEQLFAAGSLTMFAPFDFFFYKETFELFTAGSAVMSVFTLLTYYALGALLAVTIFKTLMGFTENKFKSHRALHIAITALSIVLLTLSIVFLFMFINIINSLNGHLLIKVTLAAMPIVLVVFMTCMLIQHLILVEKTKKNTVQRTQN